MATHVALFAEISDPFDAYIGDIVYATMTSVGRRGRPRAQVLIPVWETVKVAVAGHLTTHLSLRPCPMW